uniref:Interleukin-1 beta n=1 Tax=Astyanax mexicanus TaxID=7994 RepID=A0A3B1K9C6_ASTMX
MLHNLSSLLNILLKVSCPLSQRIIIADSPRASSRDDSLPRVYRVYRESNMEQGNPLCGGVSLCHTLVDEKHCYEVENALTHSSSTFKKGDKISKINNKKTQDMPPKEFIRMLSSESPMLTIHQAIADNEEDHCLEADSIRAIGEEKITLSFQLEMVREECLEAEEENKIWESDEMEDKEDLVLVSMTKTNVAVVCGRGCDPENPCSNCNINKCNTSEVVVTATKSEVTSVSSQSLMMKTKLDVVMCSLVKIWSCKNVPFSEDITIFYYCSNIFEDLSRGSPVVLNFTGSTNFLKCTCKDQKIGLTIESFDKEKLSNICKDDPDAWPFVFYMKTERSDYRVFESAAYRGWFIRTAKSMTVGNRTSETQENFCFLVYSKNK